MTIDKLKRSDLFYVGLFMAIGIALGGYFISQTMYNAKVALNTAEAKGLAERRVQADRANWDISFSIGGAQDSEIADLYKEAERQQKVIVDLLKQNGFEEGEIEADVIDYSFEEYRDENNNLVDAKHALHGLISVETNKVDMVSKARAAVSKLIADGIYVSNRSPRYYFTKLNEIKPEMLREATQNARIAANEFAENAGAKVGRIRSARQGGFIIRDAGEEYGDTNKIEKEVRIVTTITFYLTD